MTVSLVLDTDIGTDVDDALALAFAVRHPDIDMWAVTTVSGDTTRRARIAKKLLHLAGRDDIEVAAGLGGPGGGRGAELGHEGVGFLEPHDDLTLSERDGMDVLLQAPRGATIATIGMQSNVAAAVSVDPAMTERVSCLAVMGGVFGRLPPELDHNLMVDPTAAVAALNAGFRTLYVPLDVTVDVAMTTADLEALRRGDELCRALAAQVDRWTPLLRRMAGDRLPGDAVAILHDPLTVACTVERRFATIETLPVTVTLDGGAVHTVVDHEAGRPADVVRAVDVPAFRGYWLDTVLGSS